jgi:acetyl esterase/lipase
MTGLAYLVTVSSLACLLFSVAQPQRLTAIVLWPQGAPGAIGSAEKDIPTLTPYRVRTGTAPHSAVVICPGGGYEHLAAHEGEDYALFLNAHGIDAFVLRYRLGSDGYRYPAAFQDLRRAVRLVRAHAAEWGIDPAKVGAMGSSAGGHLASTLLTHFDQGNRSSSDSIEWNNCRPDFGILCYPVISMGAMTHEGSRRALLGERPDTALIELLSNEQHVTPQTPPCFLWHTDADQTVKVENTLAFAIALRENGVPFDLHIYAIGGHGMGLGDKPPFEHVHPWADDLVFWLKGLHIIHD